MGNLHANLWSIWGMPQKFKWTMKCQTDRNQREQNTLEIVLFICKSEKHHKHQRKHLQNNDKSRTRILEFKFRGRKVECKEARKLSTLSVGLCFLLYMETVGTISSLSLSHVRDIIQFLFICKIPSNSKLSVSRKIIVLYKGICELTVVLNQDETNRGHTCRNQRSPKEVK